MKQAYDFSKAVRGKIFREGAELQLPICSNMRPQAEFAQGQIVCLASDPSIRGAHRRSVAGNARRPH